MRPWDHHVNCWYYKIPTGLGIVRSKMQEKTQIISSESVSQLNGHGKNNQIILDDTFVFLNFSWLNSPRFKTFKLASSRWQETRCWPETQVPVRHLLWWIIDAAVHISTFSRALNGTSRNFSMPRGPVDSSNVSTFSPEAVPVLARQVRHGAQHLGLPAPGRLPRLLLPR